MVRLDLAPCALGEGPLWRRETGEFVFTDILAGTLYACTPGGAVRRLLKCCYQLGAFLFDRAGGLLLMTESGVFRCPYGGDESDFQLVWQVPMAPGERFNDAICDPAGRVLAGTKTEENRNGSLWLFEHGRPPRRLLEGLKISNGMGFSRDGERFYHTDSGDRAIYCYTYNVSEGTLSNRQIAVLLEEPGAAVPDGMTLDAQGMLWTACWDAGCVRRYTPGGRLLEELPFPARQVSSVAFGGSRLDTLLVTSAAVGSDGPDEGSVWLVKTAFCGLDEHRAALPAPLQPDGMHV
ncbi:SMP-30/gluconolactonase/LRE family protein [Anaerotruncus colihominis]|uniref:SMP-30/gluconolactonase/LRE family protein n=1 Tax=Anaerotruncus colihominis TaxID=169435 RepID=A0A845RRP3_9FIRM|nr:SMP-30/gluconolactonase/LRE family protein [Anaerotruncus colihominis]NBI80292.1 SMP-30/gluconolactonase/LRE family protein [Anaerotruncus colihominis]